MIPQEHTACLDACIECSLECEHCAEACLHEDDSAFADCVRLCRDAAGFSWQAATFISRDSSFVDEVCRLGADICEACAAECDKHDREFCQLCADACRRCAEECRHLNGVLIG